MPDDKLSGRQQQQQRLFSLNLGRRMWLLWLFVCVSTAGGLPVNRSQETTTSIPVGGVTLNETQNATTVSPGMISLTLNPPRTDSPETLAELQGGLSVQEGDILLQEDRNAVETLWLDATIPYTISKDLADRESNIHDAFKMISGLTCIRFKPHTTEFNYVKFENGEGCASFVGCQGGGQKLYFSKSCSVGNLCHEIVHALGLYHEHTRQDRDNYVTVEWNNIMAGRKKDFKKKRGNTLDLPYDLKSIMHYGQYFFSKDGGPTVLPKQNEAQMGQRDHLSDLDIQKLNKLYHCAERSG